MLSSTEWPGAAPAAAGRGRGRNGQHTLGIGAGLGEHRPHQAPPRGGARLVAWKIPGRRSSPRVTTAGARSAVKVGDPCWSSTSATRRRPRQAQGGGDDVGAVGPAQPARPHNGGPGPALTFARQLGGAVDRGRARGVPLPVRTRGGPVEDVVGRHVDDVRSNESGGLGDVAGAGGIHGVRQVHVGLAALDRRQRAAVQDELGRKALNVARTMSRSSTRMVSMSVASTSCCRPGRRPSGPSKAQRRPPSGTRPARQSSRSWPSSRPPR